MDGLRFRLESSDSGFMKFLNIFIPDKRVVTEIDLVRYDRLKVTDIAEMTESYKF